MTKINKIKTHIYDISQPLLKEVLCHSDLLLIEQKKANKVFSAFFYFISFVYSVIYLGEKEQEEKRYLSRHESLGNHSAHRERERDNTMTT